MERLSSLVRRVTDWLMKIPNEDSGPGSDRRAAALAGRPEGDSLLALALLIDEGVFTYVDDAFAQVFDYSRGEKLLNSNWRCLFASETAERFNRKVMSRLRREGSWQGTFSGELKSGTELDLRLNLTQATTDGGVWRITNVSAVTKGTEEMSKEQVDRVDGEGSERVASLRKGLAELQERETKGDIYDTSLKVVDRILSCEFCLLHLPEESTLMAKGDYLRGYSDGGPARGLMGSDLSTLTLKKNEVIRDNDLSRHFQRGKLSEVFNCFAGVPIEGLGSLQVFSAKREEFTELEVDFLRILAHHLKERIARAELEGEVLEKAIRDQLTGLYNRHYLSDVLDKEVERARRYDHTISFLMVDINGFKEVNDHYSHAKGDQVLKDIGETLTDNVREVDTVFRYGGDEFLILLPETGEGSRVVAKRLKEGVRIWSEETEKLGFPLTIAIGSSNLKSDTEVDVEEKIREADRRMYEDKREGK